MQISSQNLNAVISLGCFPLRCTLLWFSKLTSAISQALSPGSGLVLNRARDVWRWWISTKFGNTERPNDGDTILVFFYKKKHLFQWWATSFWGASTKRECPNIAAFWLNRSSWSIWLIKLLLMVLAFTGLRVVTIPSRIFSALHL